ncbi:hypothetical protein IMX26_01720 [Clostridium sp. 'deep sea']|uniref:RCC1 domain-containing protein n=1 Tax=Clostridium sp. 'deep sea' TaxID=2779445 RepID=UPI0018964990|nr:hypothetical protein [Clostridium sp. 'deep sea']QOR35585.1 hypothetical protein IMX26_01720 [Clostridium sp. 'deep sea']
MVNNNKLLKSFLALFLLIAMVAFNNHNIAFASENIKNADAEYEITDIAVSHEYYSVLRSDGTVWYWNRDSKSPKPHLVEELTNVKNIVSTSNNYAIKEDDSVSSWYAYDMEDPETKQPYKYYVADEVKNFENTATLMQGDHVLSLKKDGSVWGYYSNYYGELGPNNLGIFAKEVFQVEGLNNIHKTAVDFGITLALQKDGTLWFLGENRGQLGTCLNTKLASTPIKVDIQYMASEIKDISLSQWNSVFLKTDGTVDVCGDYFMASYDSPTKISIDSVVEIEHEGDFVCFLKDDGSVWMQDYSKKIPYKITELSNITSIEHNYKYLSALSKNGEVFVWKLGETPQKVSFPFNAAKKNIIKADSQILDISANYNSYSVLRNDGTVWCWKADEDIVKPRMVKGLNNVSNIVSGLKNYVLKENGTVTLWKEYDIVYAYNDNVDKGYEISAVEGLTDVISLSQYNHLVALKKDNTVWGLGRNDCGELGTMESTTNKAYPIVGLNNVIDIKTGYHITVVKKNDKSVWFLGYNNGQGGEDYELFISYDTPQKITNLESLNDEKEIRPGSFCCGYLMGDGSFYKYGKYRCNDKHKPIKFEISNIKDIILENMYMCFIKDDGTVWFHDYINNDKLIQLKSLNNIIAIKSYGHNLIALSNNGDVYTWSLKNLNPKKINLPFQPVEINYNEICRVDMTYEETDLAGVMQAKVEAHMQDGSVYDVTHAKNMYYNSEDKSIATVTNKGVIALFKNEEAQITVTFVTDEGTEITFTDEGKITKLLNSDAVIFAPYRTLSQSSENGNNKIIKATNDTLRIDGKKSKSIFEAIGSFFSGSKEEEKEDSNVDENGVSHYYHTLIDRCYLSYEPIYVPPKNTYVKREYKAPAMPAKALRITAIYVFKNGVEVELPPEYTKYSTSSGNIISNVSEGEDQDEARIIYADDLECGELKISTKFKLFDGEKLEKGYAKKLASELILQVRPNMVGENLFYNNGILGTYRITSASSFKSGASQYISAITDSCIGIGVEGLNKLPVTIANQYRNIKNEAAKLKDSKWKKKNENLLIPEYAIGDYFKDINGNYSLAYSWTTGSGKKSVKHVAFGTGDSIVHMSWAGTSIETKVYKGTWVPVKH